MNLRAIDFDWNRARAFLVTAEKGSYSAAAKAMKLAQPTLGRQVAALEAELGVVLFEKVGKSLELTPSGLELLEFVRRMAEAASQFSLSASGKTSVIEGAVCISASESFAAYLLPPILMKLRKVQPKIRVELVSTNESSDLRRREADIAIRNYRPKQPELIAKKINEANYYMYATPSYIRRSGPFEKVDDLNRANFIGFTEIELMIRELNRFGLKLTKDNFPFITASHFTHWELAKNGAGIGMMAGQIGDRESKVRRVLDKKLPPMRYESWLVSHRELKTNRRIKFVFDFLYQEICQRFSENG